MAIKYIIFDLDDTLLRKNKTISDYTVETMKKPKKKAIKLYLILLGLFKIPKTIMMY